MQDVSTEVGVMLAIWAICLELLHKLSLAGLNLEGDSGGSLVSLLSGTGWKVLDKGSIPLGLNFSGSAGGVSDHAWGWIIQLILVKIYIYTFLSLYCLFGLMVIIVHEFMTYLTYLWNIYGYFVAKDKMFGIDDGMNWADHVIFLISCR